MMTPGRYTVKAIDAALCEASTGTPQVEVVFQVTEGECIGETISWFGFLTDAALPYTLRSLRFTGFEGNDLSDLESVGSQECSITVKEDTWEGETRLKVEWVNDLGGIRSKAMSDPANFAKQMMAKIAALEAGQKPKEASLDEVLQNDDVPFDV